MGFQTCALPSLTVRDGKFVLPDGMSYSVLVLPQLKTMRPELLEKIDQLVRAGGIVLGPRPERSPSLANYGEADERIQELAAGIWGESGRESCRERVRKYV